MIHRILIGLVAGGVAISFLAWCLVRVSDDF